MSKTCHPFRIFNKFCLNVLNNFQTTTDQIVSTENVTVDNTKFN